MTAYENGTASTVPPTSVRLLLGLVLIVGGVFVLGDIALATMISTVVIGVTAIVVGAFEMMHAFWMKGWSGFIWQFVLGILYVVFGAMVVNQPVSGALVLTYILGLLLAASGIVRLFVGVKHWSDVGWTMVLSGAFGFLAGLVILTGWPTTGLWVLGFLLGIDLISHGIAWLAYGWLPAAKTA
ncbi:HdeD family acid-resistance protein [Mesorhizobium sp. YC-39]|uniref:HdeD family acid-resistance protein n=1 Tax=unclassified Mesorhizobium TaxID=325217 RepID=UPI0021E88F6F|nr:MULTISPECIES: HdeD family acid-resistance protein [unclassified Mesorhizobium]MCV3211137.1 HdeD family acid-resistance protein [Mesorhizobium sp. YC-2]MCV3232862.1 HdeD family acid-resistance protein [Mesorhizobium sp. YC-39]